MKTILRSYPCVTRQSDVRARHKFVRYVNPLIGTQKRVTISGRYGAIRLVQLSPIRSTAAQYRGKYNKDTTNIVRVISTTIKRSRFFAHHFSGTGHSDLVIFW